jgi:hypothetical protein
MVNDPTKTTDSLLFNLHLTTSLPSVRFARKYGSLEVLQTYGPPRPLTGRAFTFTVVNTDIFLKMHNQNLFKIIGYPE